MTNEHPTTYVVALSPPADSGWFDHLCRFKLTEPPQAGTGWSATFAAEGSSDRCVRQATFERMRLARLSAIADPETAQPL
ncbi:MAG TPA: hypothetical protein VGE47_02110 [Burkholderiaceae bacterium]